MRRSGACYSTYSEVSVGTKEDLTYERWRDHTAYGTYTELPVTQYRAVGLQYDCFRWRFKEPPDYCFDLQLVHHILLFLLRFVKIS